MSAHDHEHHEGGGHGHGVSASSDARWLLIALLINLGFMLVEVGVGIAANSLALLSDAAHMLTDAAAIGLAILALRLAQRPPKGAFTFGLKRGEILSAQVNGVLLFVLAGIIGIEAITGSSIRQTWTARSSSTRACSGRSSTAPRPGRSARPTARASTCTARSCTTSSTCSRRSPPRSPAS